MSRELFQPLVDGRKPGPRGRLSALPISIAVHAAVLAAVVVIPVLANSALPLIAAGGDPGLDAGGAAHTAASAHAAVDTASGAASARHERRAGRGTARGVGRAVALEATRRALRHRSAGGWWMAASSTASRPTLSTPRLHHPRRARRCASAG